MFSVMLSPLAMGSSSHFPCRHGDPKHMPFQSQPEHMHWCRIMLAYSVYIVWNWPYHASFFYWNVSQWFVHSFESSDYSIVKCSQFEESRRILIGSFIVYQVKFLDKILVKRMTAKNLHMSAAVMTSHWSRCLDSPNLLVTVTMFSMITVVRNSFR